MFGPEAFHSVLRNIARILDECEIPFLLTGGFVAIYYAEPRLTQDVDLVVDPSRMQAQLDPFLDFLKQDDYVFNADTIREAARSGRMFQVIDSRDYLKIVLYPREIVPGQFERIVNLEVTPDLYLPFSSRPDLVISKLIWISKGSHKSRRDVKQILLRATAAETALVHQFADQMNLRPLLDEVLAEPDEIDT